MDIQECQLPDLPQLTPKLQERLDSLFQTLDSCTDINLLRQLLKDELKETARLGLLLGKAVESLEKYSQETENAQQLAREALKGWRKSQEERRVL
jgi:hypothetical protein